MATINGTDYTKRRKDALVIRIGEGEGFELSVLPPTKGIYDDMLKVAEAVDGVVEGTGEGIDFDACLAAVARAMSNNSRMREVTPEMLDSYGFDLSDVGDFVALYIHFIAQLVEAKN